MSKEQLAKRWSATERDNHDRINRVKQSVHEGFAAQGNAKGGAMYLFDMGLRFALEHPDLAKSYLAQEEALVLDHFQSIGSKVTERELRKVNEGFIEALVNDEDTPVVRVLRRETAKAKVTDEEKVH